MIERHIAAVEHVVHTKEAQAALERTDAGNGGIGVKLSEIIDRTVLQFVLLWCFSGVVVRLPS